MSFTESLKYLFLSFALVAAGIPALQSQDIANRHLCDPSSGRSVFLRSKEHYGGECRWLAQKYADVDAGGAEVSSREYAPKNWYPASVPGTVLTTLVRNKVFGGVGSQLLPGCHP